MYLIAFLSTLSPSEPLNVRVILGNSDTGSESREVPIIRAVS